MAFTLGNFAVKEVLYGVAQALNTNQLLYTLDQLTSASIEVSSDPTEITDKNGNVLRTIYKSKTATVTASSALISPVLLNANSGSDIKTATESAPIDMPKILTIGAGETITLSDLDTDANDIHVMGIYPSGANGDVLTQSTSASLENKTFALNDKTVTVPAQSESGEGAPVYFIKYAQSNTKGIQLENTSKDFPKTIQLTFYAAVMDPCQDTYRAAYIYIPSFTPDPSCTIALDSESTTMDYTGNINVDACSGDKVLYYIYFPDEEAVTTGEADTPSL